MRYQGGSFLLVDALAGARFIHATGVVVVDGVVLHARGGEGGELLLVVAVVGECDEAFRLTAVVPAQVHGGYVAGQTLVQNAFHVLFGGGVVFLLLILAAGEEAGGRHLPRVAHDDGVAPAPDSADGIPHRNLRGFVEDDHIEGLRIGGEILRHGKRAHEHAGLEQRGEVRNAGEQLSQRHVGSLFGELSLQQCYLGAVAGDAAGTLNQTVANLVGGGLQQVGILLCKIGDAAFVDGGHELQQRFVLRGGGAESQACQIHRHSFGEELGGNTVLLQFLYPAGVAVLLAAVPKHQIAPAGAHFLQGGGHVAAAGGQAGVPEQCLFGCGERIERAAQAAGPAGELRQVSGEHGKQQGIGIRLGSQGGGHGFRLCQMLVSGFESVAEQPGQGGAILLLQVAAYFLHAHQVLQVAETICRFLAAASQHLQITPHAAHAEEAGEESGYGDFLAFPQTGGQVVLLQRFGRVIQRKLGLQPAEFTGQGGGFLQYGQGGGGAGRQQQLQSGPGVLCGQLQRGKQFPQALCQQVETACCGFCSLFPEGQLLQIVSQAAGERFFPLGGVFGGVQQAALVGGELAYQFVVQLQVACFFLHAGFFLLRDAPDIAVVHLELRQLPVAGHKVDIVEQAGLIRVEVVQLPGQQVELVAQGGHGVYLVIPILLAGTAAHGFHRGFVLRQHVLLVRLVRVQLQAEGLEPHAFESFVHHLQSRCFLGHEEHGLAVRQAFY